MTVSQRTVKTGTQDGERIAITEGLQPGDTVVIDGADRLRDGAQVSIPKPAGTIQAPSANAAAGGAAGGRRGLSTAVLQRVTTACGDDTKKYCATPEQLAPPQRAGGFGGGRQGAGARGAGFAGGAAMTPEMRQQMRVIGCLQRNRIALSSQCAAALPAQRQRGAGGGRGGRGGFP
jgi:hypothetical protein